MTTFFKRPPAQKIHEFSLQRFFCCVLKKTDMKIFSPKIPERSRATSDHALGGGGGVSCVGR